MFAKERAALSINSIMFIVYWMTRTMYCILYFVHIRPIPVIPGDGVVTTLCNTVLLDIRSKGSQYPVFGWGRVEGGQ